MMRPHPKGGLRRKPYGMMNELAGIASEDADVDDPEPEPTYDDQSSDTFGSALGKHPRPTGGRLHQSVTVYSYKRPKTSSNCISSKLRPSLSANASSLNSKIDHTMSSGSSSSSDSDMDGLDNERLMQSTFSGSRKLTKQDLARLLQTRGKDAPVQLLEFDPDLLLGKHGMTALRGKDGLVSSWLTQLMKYESLDTPKIRLIITLALCLGPEAYLKLS